MKAAGYISDLGEPTAFAKSVAERILRGDQLGNQAVKDSMSQTDPGSSLTDWWKLSTPRLTLNDVPYEIHFYENVVDGTLYLGRDYFLVFKQVF